MSCIVSYKAELLMELIQSSVISSRGRTINHSPDMKSPFLIAALCLLSTLCLTWAAEQEELDDPFPQDRYTLV